MPGNRLDLLGINFNNLTLPAVIDELIQRPRARRFTYIVTPNADHIARLQRQPGLRLVYDAAWLRVLDSKFIWHAARALRQPVPQVTTGADITAALLSNLAAQTIAVIGMSPVSLQALQSRYPHLTIAHHAPPQNLLNDQLGFCRARDFAVSTNARFTFIALGSPLQELLAYAIACQPNALGIGLCIGSALEFCAGTEPRAPAWMRDNGLEWLHRLARNPRRLVRRYLIDDPPVLLALLRQTCR
ncbi:MAG: WecB/TagA/CpsF family glycosyltransferase [Acidocella sp.]|nr:WecB/TagA/CpsF family glycosyltransferase [Acidocella sp.]